jgi:hypothetical protein
LKSKSKSRGSWNEFFINLGILLGSGGILFYLSHHPLLRPGTDEINFDHLSFYLFHGVMVLSVLGSVGEILVTIILVIIRQKKLREISPMLGIIHIFNITLLSILLAIFGFFDGYTYDAVSSNRIKELGKLHAELTPLPKTELDKGSGRSRGGGALVYYNVALYSQLSIQEVTKHYDQELKKRGWVLQKFRQGKKSWLGGRDESKMREVQYTKEISEGREIELQMNYLEDTKDPTKILLEFHNSTHSITASEYEKLKGDVNLKTGHGLPLDFLIKYAEFRDSLF